MLRLKQYIAIWLLWVFLLPQLASALHYLLVEHRLVADTEVVLHKGTVEVDNHACLFHLKAFSSFLLARNQIVIGVFHYLQPVRSRLRFQNYDKTPAFNFFLRGPPIVFELNQSLEPPSGV